MRKVIIILLTTVILQGCGGVEVSSKVLDSASKVCDSNEGLESVHFSEGENFSFTYYTATCNNGFKVTVNREVIDEN